MTKEKKYRLSFTAASLRLTEMSNLSKIYLEHGSEEPIVKEQVIRGRNARTTDREFREINFRVKNLSNPQLEILAYGDMIAQRQIALLSICKLYAFIRDFIVEVLRNKVLVFDYHLTGGEYITFFKRKSEAHPELEELAESTSKKVKQLTYKILEQAGLIDDVNTKNIVPQIVDSKVFQTVVDDHPEWLKIYLLSDLDIAGRIY